MGRKYAIRDQEQFHFVTFTVVEWIDVFTRDDYRQLLVESIQFCQKEKGLLVGAWCIMPNHAHFILGTTGAMPLSDIIRDLKAFTSRHIRKAIETNSRESRKAWMMEMFTTAGKQKSNNRDFQFWQQHNHPIEMNSNTKIDSRINYIHNNPVTAGFVEEPREWRYSSARDYEGEKGMINIYFLD